MILADCTLYSFRALAIGGAAGKAFKQSNYVASRICNAVSLSAVSAELCRKFLQTHDVGELASMWTFGVRAGRSLLQLALRLDTQDPAQKQLQNRIVGGAFMLGLLGDIGCQLYFTKSFDPKTVLPLIGLGLDCYAEASDDQRERRPRFIATAASVLPYGLMTHAWGLVGKITIDVASGAYFMWRHKDPTPREVKYAIRQVKRLIGAAPRPV